MYGLSDSVVAEIGAIFRRHPNIKEVLLFGSRAKGTYSAGSDIDLAVMGEGISCDQMLTLGMEIDDLELLYKVDLLDYARHADTPIGAHIRRVGKPFYRKTE